MTSRMDELEDLIISGRKPTSNIIKAIQRRFAGKGNLTNTEKRKLQALKRKARKNVDIENMFRDAPVLDAVITKGNLSEPFDRRNIKTAKPKKKPIRLKGSAAARDRADTKTVTPSKRESSVKDVAPLGGSSYEIKKGDTLSAIARRNNTTVAALMRMNPKIKDKNKIRAGQFIKVGSPEKAKAKTKSAKDLRGKPTSVAEAKRRGMDSYFVINSKGEEVEKAAVTASELKKSGLTLRQYLNKKK